MKITNSFNSFSKPGMMATITTTREPGGKANTLSSKAGAAVWRSLGPKTKWRMIKANTAILSSAAARSVARNPRKVALALAVLAGTILGAVMLRGRNNGTLRKK